MVQEQMAPKSLSLKVTKFMPYPHYKPSMDWLGALPLHCPPLKTQAVETATILNVAEFCSKGKN